MRGANMRTWVGSFSAAPRGAGSFQFDIPDVADEPDVAAGVVAGMQALRHQAFETARALFAAEWS